MSNRIHVGTRKGLFTINRANGRWAIDHLALAGDPISAVMFDRRDNRGPGGPRPPRGNQ